MKWILFSSFSLFLGVAIGFFLICRLRGDFRLRLMISSSFLHHETAFAVRLNPASVTVLARRNLMILWSHCWIICFNKQSSFNGAWCIAYSWIASSSLLMKYWVRLLLRLETLNLTKSNLSGVRNSLWDQREMNKLCFVHTILLFFLVVVGRFQIICIGHFN